MTDLGYTLSMESNDGEQYAELNLTREQVRTLHGDVADVREEDPDYPDAWANENQYLYDRLLSLLAPPPHSVELE